MKKGINKIENCMIYVIMILSFFMYSSLTQNTVAVSIIIWPTIFISMICLIYRVFHYKQYTVNSFHKYIIIFLISYAISSVLNMTYGYYQNLRTLILMTILIGLIYTKIKDGENQEKTIQKFSQAFIIITTILSFGSLCIFNISQLFVNIGNEEIYMTGLRWGRLKGLYNDFNYGGMINAIAVTMAIYFCSKDKKVYQKCIYGVTILINFAFIALSDSRSSLIALIMAVIAFFTIAYMHRYMSIDKKIGYGICVIAITLVICIPGKMGIKNLFTYFYDNEEESITVSIDNNIIVKKQLNDKKTNTDEKDEETETIPETVKDLEVKDKNKKQENIYHRGYAKEEDISNRRFDLWNSALEIWKTSPIYGVSFENVETYCRENLPDTYLIHNDYKAFDNFHNIIFNVIASQGLIGIVILLAMGIYLLMYLGKYILYLLKQNNENHIKHALSIACILIGCISTMFIGDILYYISPSTVAFWFFLGYILNEIYVKKGKQETKLVRAIKKGFRILQVYIFNVFPIKQDKIVLANFNGKPYGDNAKYIVEEINRRGLSCDMIWILQNLEDKNTLPKNVRAVKYNSIPYFYHICTAKIWIDNHRKIIDLKKRKQQYYIQTWHGGIALKKIEKDAQDALEPQYIKQAIHDSEMIDLMISNSQFCTEMYKRAFWYQGKILECGSPRNDILIQNEQVNKQGIYNKLGIDESEKVILYAPTFRKDENLTCYDIDFENLLEHLRNLTKQDWVVVLRLHPNIANKSEELFNNNTSNNMINASHYGDMYELMAIADMLITDYSSVMFEFSFTKKPVFLYAKDIENYIQDRGFYFEYTQLPYPVSVNNEQLNNNIQKFNQKQYQEKLENFFKQIKLYEKGMASQKIVNIIEEKIKGE